MKLSLQPSLHTISHNGKAISNLHLLKAVGAFMVIAIHANGMFPSWIEGWTRYGVVAFLMITGYFLPGTDGTLDTDRIKRDIIKIFKLDVFIQTVYILFHIVRSLYTPGYFDETFLSLHNWIIFFVTGRFFGYQLWYLHALILALSTVWILTKLHLERLIYVLAFIGPVINLVTGSYLFLYSDADLSPFVSRNFLTVGIPSIAMGIWLRRNESRLPSLRVLLTTFIIAALLSVAECALIIDVKSKGDIMLMTLPSTLLLFSICLRAPQVKASNRLASIGQHHSMNLYLYHVMVIFILYDITILWEVIDDFYFWIYPVTVALTYLLSISLKRVSPGRVRIFSGALSNKVR